ncbi:ComF family protein [Saccharopolyspora griseoalba]|uniref:ComF family protein n=1 Tax=Saccharopolyspora griseoalba TaxID=1431848 RepID=A0ABW2LL29_9PSEU
MWIERLRTGISGLVDLVLPQQCAGCGREGTSWCRECAGGLGGLHRVHRPLLADAPPAYALGAYRGPARRAVLAYKEAGRRDLAGPLAGQLRTALRALAEVGSGEWWLVPAPSRAITSRRRGGAHMTRIASRVAGAPGADPRARVADCLLLARWTADSAGLAPQQRLDNLAGRVLLRPGRLPPPGARIAVLDDVVTTGATAASSAAVLAEAGLPVALVLALTATAG